MLPGETMRSGADPRCCGKELKLEVLQSAAGWYVGTQCPNCGPYSRESCYYRTYYIAAGALLDGSVEWRT